MQVVDVFNITTNSGPTVTGKIEKGKVVIGQKIILISDGIETVVEVTGLEKFQATNLQEIESGPDDVGITIRGVTHDKIKRGDILKTNG